MIMRIHSDASYQSETESLSRADGLLIFGITQLQRHQRKQRCRSHYLWNHQKRYVGGFWRWMRIHLYQLQAHSPTTDHTQGNGTPTSSHLRPNQQFRHRSNHEFNHATKTVLSNGHALLLSAGLHFKKTFQQVLETRINKFWRLSYKTSCAHPSL